MQFIMDKEKTSFRTMTLGKRVRKYTLTDKLACGKRTQQNKARRMMNAHRKKKGQRPLTNNQHVDHIHPLSLGGSNTMANLQVLSAKKNMQKGNRI